MLRFTIIATRALGLATEEARVPTGSEELPLPPCWWESHGHALKRRRAAPSLSCPQPKSPKQQPSNTPHLVDGHHDGYPRRVGVADGLNRLRPHAVVGSHDDDCNICDLSAAGAHGREGLQTKKGRGQGGALGGSVKVARWYRAARGRGRSSQPDFPSASCQLSP